jgi:hypothetical protein
MAELLVLLFLSFSPFESEPIATDSNQIHLLTQALASSIYRWVKRFFTATIT